MDVYDKNVEIKLYCKRLSNKQQQIFLGGEGSETSRTSL